METVKMVVGFAFDVNLERVLLILKDHPEWQKGRWNGLGGKIAMAETPKAAMSREFEEECGVDIDLGHWDRVAILSGPGWTVDVMTVRTEILGLAQACEDEKVRVFRVEDLSKIPPENIIANLGWLIPLCIDQLRHGSRAPISVEVRYAH